jgi:hypothetical protein
VKDKIIAYEQSSNQDWQQKLVFIADNVPDPAGDFEASAEALINNFVKPGYEAKYIRVGAYCPPGSPASACLGAKHEITSTLNTQGALIALYVGHGATQRWTQEFVFTYYDITKLTNGSRLPVIVSLTCLDGYWIGPYGPLYKQGPSLIEEIVRAPAKGAIAAFAPGGLGVASGHDILADGFYQAIFDDGIWNLGAASLSARLALYTVGGHDDLIETYNLFGDPALRLPRKYQAPSVAPNSQAQEGVTGTTVQYTLQVTNTASITDTFELAASGNAWPTTPLAPVGPLGPGQSAEATVNVFIPDDALAESQDVAEITVFSRGDRSRTITVMLVTTANVYRPGVQPATAASFGPAGQPVTYTITALNLGNLSDTFTVAVGAANWPVSAPASVGPLAGGTAMDFPVVAQIPAGAPDGAMDEVAITLTSSGDVRRSTTFTLTTTVVPYGVDLEAAIYSQTVRIGSTALYTVTVTNTSPYTDAFTLEASGNQWSVVFNPSSMVLLGSGQTAEVLVRVAVPTGVVSGTLDVATIRSVSVGDPSRWAVVTLQTTAISGGYRVYAPIVIRSYP